MTRLVIGYDPGTPEGDHPAFVAFYGRRMVGAWRSLPGWLALLVRLRLAVLVE